MSNSQVMIDRTAGKYVRYTQRFSQWAQKAMIFFLIIGLSITWGTPTFAQSSSTSATGYCINGCTINTPDPGQYDLAALNSVKERKPATTSVVLCNITISKSLKKAMESPGYDGQTGCGIYVYNATSQAWTGAVTGLTEYLCGYMYGLYNDNAPCIGPVGPDDSPASSKTTQDWFSFYTSILTTYGSVPGGIWGCFDPSNSLGCTRL